MNRASLRILLCTIVAISAAAIADPLLESASNAGCFGPGTFTDGSSLDVLPALVIATLLALLYVAMRAYLAQKSSAEAVALRTSLKAGTAAPAWQTVPCTYLVQLGVLFAMETLEQIVVAGHPLGGIVWLGAPLVIALVVHGVVSVTMSLALARVLEALSRTAVDIARFVLAFFSTRACTPPPLDSRRLDSAFAAESNPLASFSGERAPPLAAS